VAARRVAPQSPLICPTCASPDPAVRYVVAEFGNGAERPCENEWHDDDAGTCQSDP
jgi:hypothetical protein